jgi:hypothetical protein
VAKNQGKKSGTAVPGVLLGALGYPSLQGHSNGRNGGNQEQIGEESVGVKQSGVHGQSNKKGCRWKG